MKKESCLLLFSFVMALLLTYKSTFSSSPDRVSRLFEGDKIVEIQITGEINKIIKDRKKKGKRTYHPAKITYKKKDGSQNTIDVLIGTRGIFRLDPRVCNFPPLMLKFDKSAVKQTIFAGIKKLKLVTHCQDKKKVSGSGWPVSPTSTPAATRSKKKKPVFLSNR